MSLFSAKLEGTSQPVLSWKRSRRRFLGGEA